MTPDEFWNMSAGEVLEVAEARAKRRREEIEQLATLVWKGGQLVYFAAHDIQNYPERAQAFPELFKQEDKKADWQVIKARMLKYAEAKRQVRK